MALFLTLLPILAQIGPFTPGGASTVPNVPHVEGRDQPRRPAPVRAPVLPAAATTADKTCREAMEASPAEAALMAGEWIARSQGAELAAAQACMGQAQGRLGKWTEAEAAFTAARDAADKDQAGRASYGAMAGNAALAGGQADRALADLTLAGQDAAALADKTVGGEIAIDRARALVALGRQNEARMALDQATTDAPANSDGWLLSATLWRRLGSLDKAQAHIEKAAALAPVDPAIGLEAGVIAALGNRDAAARRSWQSVISAAPQSPEAAQARHYLDQVPEPPALPIAPAKAAAPRPAASTKAPVKPTGPATAKSAPKAAPAEKPAAKAPARPDAKSKPQATKAQSVKPSAAPPKGAAKAEPKASAKPAKRAPAGKPAKASQGKS